MDTASTQPGHLVLPVTPAQTASNSSRSSRLLSGLPPDLAHDLWVTAKAKDCDLSLEEFLDALAAVGEKFNFGHAPGTLTDPAARANFLSGLRLTDLSLATACALGREVAWQRFLSLYRAPLTQAAIAITGSATLGHDLADFLYAELYGLRGAAVKAAQEDPREVADSVEVERVSPLSSYSGRGSLLGWLRTTLAQRHVDYHRRTHRETPLDTLDVAAPDPSPSPVSAELSRLTQAIGRTLQKLDAQDRFLLSAYFLDRQTLLQVGRTLHVHEATISRRIKRLTVDLRERLLHNLQGGGLSRRAAEEALGIDPRDLEINLRALLQTSQSPPFPAVTAPDNGASNNSTTAEASAQL